jgi:nicotinamidase-related amidase
MTNVPTLLDPTNCVLLMIDFQSQMAFATVSISGQELINNSVALAKAARVFNVPTILTTVAEKTFSGPVFQALREVLSEHRVIDRTTMNFWEDPQLMGALKKTGRKKLVLAGLWTEVCIALPALDALRDGYEVYVVADACGGSSVDAHNWAMERMIQAGAQPITWLQFMLELQRDWARQETYNPVLNVALQHAGAYGIGVQYAKAILGAHANEGKA